MPSMRVCEIRTIARRVRRWAERVAASNNDYGADLAGMCAVASRQLLTELLSAGYQAKVAYQWNHCFVLVEGYIVDITATQFNQPKVIVRCLDRAKKRGLPQYWRHTNTYKTSYGLNRRLIKDHWPKHQTKTPR